MQEKSELCKKKNPAFVKPDFQDNNYIKA